MAQSPATGSSPTEAGAGNGVAGLSYEQARDELVQVVNELERGAATLEQSLELWERGEALAARCEEWLIGAKTRLDRARAAQNQQAQGESARAAE
ncbi:exodeoxyribonuclease VII small subunit [Subtercola frigoramans]|uniref:Exodeoxyribonuclease 7 small subunit n=1 Tax=Subtercola frigoramans TaxID=120298 RepID=A0ABS2L3V3_9MICO|nr:exodeoxyribonuclease VII small subunit [Subtercola frigoramans]MBM7471694.1 exodeoxyribonuclease VII small subunit [Subtercola frigoramans]